MFGPNLAPKALELFCFLVYGGRNLLHPLCVFSKCSEFCGEFKCACKTGKKFSPLTFPTQPFPKSDCWDWTPSG